MAPLRRRGRNASMKMIAASLISSALLLGVSLTPFADA
jgi:hypothetical protein